MRQPTLFDKPGGQSVVDIEKVVLYALGDFQSRGKKLVDRELPLDRLRGAFRRASTKFDIDELNDELAITALESLGADVRKLPSYIAKHPYRVIVSTQLAEQARSTYAKTRSRGTDED